MANIPTFRGFATRWGVLSFVGLLLAALWIFVNVSDHVRMREDVEDAQRELSQMNAAVSQHTVALLKSVETAVRQSDRWLQENRVKDPLTDPGFLGLVEDFRRLSGGTLDLRLINQSGELFTLPAVDRKPVAKMADCSHFIAKQGPAERMVLVGDPILSGVTGTWVLPVAWRLRESIAGMTAICAVIDLERLVAIHERLRLKPAGTIALVRSDGVVLSRTPHKEALIGKNIAGSPAYVSYVRGEQLGNYIAANSVADGAPRMVSFRKLEEYPVTVFVTRGMDEVLSGYNAQRSIVLSVSTGLTLISLILGSALQLSMRKTADAHHELQHLAMIDSLTGIANRRTFLSKAQREFMRASRFSRPMAALAIDLDHFKHINDSLGHHAGDEVLRECAQAWQQALRDQDVLGRTGGEEFCAVLPETDLDGALQVANRLLSATANLRFSGGTGDYSVTASIGVATIMHSDEEIAQTLKRADRALYMAKEHGRNRIEHIACGWPQQKDASVRTALSV